MALERQRAVVGLVQAILGAEIVKTPKWLRRPGERECKQMWPVVSGVYRSLVSAELPETAPSRETRYVDAVMVRANRPSFILEFDEGQHFNGFRRITLAHYPDDLQVGFNPGVWAN